MALAVGDGALGVAAAEAGAAEAGALEAGPPEAGALEAGALLAGVLEAVAPAPVLDEELAQPASKATAANGRVSRRAREQII